MKECKIILIVIRKTIVAKDIMFNTNDQNTMVLIYVLFYEDSYDCQKYN
jgi:hypothetical protein